MQHNRFGRAVAVAGAMSISLGLSACSIGGVEIPFTENKPTTTQALQAKTNALTPAFDTASLIDPNYLTVGVRTSRTNVPFCYVGNNNTLGGLDVEYACALADELGLKVKFVDVTSMTKSLGTTCDIVMNVGQNEYSAATVVGSYAQSAIAFFHKGSMGTAKVSDLSSKTVGLQQDSTSQKALEATGLVMNQKTFSNLNDAFDALEEGSVDYVLCDAYSGGYLATQFNDIVFAGTLDSPSEVGIAVLSSNQTLAEAVGDALAKVQQGGVSDLIRSEWVGSMASLSSNDQIAEIPEKAQPIEAQTTSIENAGSNAAATA